MSTFKVIVKYVFGGMGSVVDYLLDLLNAALAKLDPANKAKIQGVLNLAEKILSTMSALKWLCPTKWQTAYSAATAAVLSVVNALEDLVLTSEELTAIRKAFAEAVTAWKSDDDETCVDCTDCTYERIAA